MTVHWCGAGLSAIPGLRRLIKDGYDVVVWNRTLEKATEAVGDITNSIRVFDKDSLQNCLKENDIIVSMLPADWHVPLASLAIVKKAHFVSSSYISPEMKNLHNAALKAKVSLVNEIGLDPGIDHLMAHKLVNELKKSELMNAETEVSFLSYCGGVPKVPNEFKYKFSWSPVGVLKALKSISAPGDEKNIVESKAVLNVMTFGDQIDIDLKLENPTLQARKKLEVNILKIIHEQVYEKAKNKVNFKVSPSK